jgi:hypothetical protein
MLNPRVALLYKNLPDKYPRVLEKDFRHVLNRLMQLWALPEFEAYTQDLMIDKRGGRQGFSRAAVAELMFLFKLHEAFKLKGYQLPEAADSWQTVPVQDPTPRGFLHAIERGQLEVMEAFLSAGVTIDFRFESNQTPLMIAAINGRLDAVRCLVEDGAGIKLKDRGDYTALHWAALYGRCQVAEELIRVGAELDARQNSGDTPLGLAVMRGHADVVELLLRHGADADIAGDQGSPLAIARNRNNQEMIALLSGTPAAQGKWPGRAQACQ